METDKYDATGQERNGLVKEYFRDGKLSGIGEYINDEKTGEWKIYDTNGTLIKTKIYK